jgi:hypothetical protein
MDEAMDQEHDAHDARTLYCKSRKPSTGDPNKNTKAEAATAATPTVKNTLA